MANFLRRFPALRTSDTEEFRDWMRSAFNPHLMDVRSCGSGFESVVDHVELPSIALTHEVFGSHIEIDLSLNGFIQVFPLSGSGGGRWNAHSTTLKPGRGFTGGPGSGGVVTYGTDYSHLLQTMSSVALTQKLSAMIGEPVDPPLRMTGRPIGNPDLVAAQFRLLTFLGGEIDRNEGAMPKVAMAEIEQAMIVAFLTANEHNYSKWLQETPREPAPWQVQRAVEYIEENSCNPITIEDLAQVTNSTGRNLLYLFKKTHGVSPIQYANRVRLNRARSMLRNPDALTSVTSAAFDCGFSNLGHFAKKYYNAFGELPSETLKNFR